MEKKQEGRKERLKTEWIGYDINKEILVLVFIFFFNFLLGYGTLETKGIINLC
jgi:hypothetical protein